MKITAFAIALFSFMNCYSQLFKEVGENQGIKYDFPGHSRQEVGAGITIIDVNNDGWDDIFQSCGSFKSKLWINNKGSFVDGTKQFGLDSICNRFIQGAISADIDNDGFEDLLLTNMGIHKGDKLPPTLLKNIDGKILIEVELESLNIMGHFPGAAWGDINKDSYVDLYIVNYVKQMNDSIDQKTNIRYYIPDCMENFLFINEKGSNFKNIAPQLGLNDDGCGLACQFTDYDNDADVDLILLNDFGHFNNKGNKIFQNNSSDIIEFTDLTDSLGFYREFYGMGISAGDINGDGFLDYYLTDICKNTFFLNKRDSFSDVSNMINRIDDDFSTSWTGLFFDYDNDMDLDFFLANGYLESIENVMVKDQSNFFIYNNESKTFIDATKDSGINDSIPNRGAALLDFDHDGDLDVVVNSIQIGRSELANTQQSIKLYENDQNENNDWLAVKLHGQKKVNKSAVGCKVMIKVNGKWMVREVDGGSGHCSQNTKTLYFGLSKKARIDEIRIIWIGSDPIILKELKRNRLHHIFEDGTIIRKKY